MQIRGNLRLHILNSWIYNIQNPGLERQARDSFGLVLLLDKRMEKLQVCPRKEQNYPNTSCLFPDSGVIVCVSLRRGQPLTATVPALKLLMEFVSLTGCYCVSVLVSRGHVLPPVVLTASVCPSILLSVIKYYQTQKFCPKCKYFSI